MNAESRRLTELRKGENRIFLVSDRKLPDAPDLFWFLPPRKKLVLSLYDSVSLSASAFHLKGT
jgi:hypothetical protein